MIELRLDYSMLHQAYVFYPIKTEEEYGKPQKKFVGRITWEELSPMDRPPPDIVMDESEMQALFDKVYKSGFRPTDAAAIDGIVVAKDLHIKQLYEISIGLLGKIT